MSHNWRLILIFYNLNTFLKILNIYAKELLISLQLILSLFKNKIYIYKIDNSLPIY